MSHNTCWVWVNTYTSTHTHTEPGATELVRASVFVYTRGRGETFLAEPQSGIRRLSLPRTSLTLFCLFLAAVARVNHSTALLAIAEKLPRAAAQLLSARYVNKAPYRVGVRGHPAVQLQWRRSERGEQQLRTGKQFFECLKKRGRKRDSCLFSQTQTEGECAVTLDYETLIVPHRCFHRHFHWPLQVQLKAATDYSLSRLVVSSWSGVTGLVWHLVKWAWWADG